MSLSGLWLFCLSIRHSLFLHTHTFLGSAPRSNPLTLDNSQGPRRNTSPFTGQNKTVADPVKRRQFARERATRPHSDPTCPASQRWFSNTGDAGTPGQPVNTALPGPRASGQQACAFPASAHQGPRVAAEMGEPAPQPALIRTQRGRVCWARQMPMESLPAPGSLTAAGSDS